MTFFSLYIGKKGVKLMRIAVDGMGGDHSPSAVVEGCVQALEEFKDIEIYITGPEDLLKKRLFLNLNTIKKELLL